MERFLEIDGHRPGILVVQAEIGNPLDSLGKLGQYDPRLFSVMWRVRL